MQILLNELTIGIATRNRWSVLEQTLQKITDAGLSQINFIVVDDASTTPIPFFISKYLKKVNIVRLNTGGNNLSARNKLINMARTPFFLQLDDDSYPILEDLKKLIDAIEYIKDNKNIFVLGFPVINPFTGLYDVQSIQSNPYQVRAFIGCAHICNVDLFMRNNGYCEDLVYSWEESDLSMRLLLQGYECWHYPHLLFHHIRTPVARSYWHMDFYGSRNGILWIDWYVPNQYRLVAYARFVASRFLMCYKTRRFGYISGTKAGFASLASFRHLRRRVPDSIYALWQSMHSY